ncbi:1-aminocyclopropane-1-carboxylate oxidase homolog [Solanum stenotomum]|uniref:1-aminocyclopropane-1-carboxylate oxidase homolog n=1 Tax=Solanum stenotomum TaxID=172797 RepID=UPI0020D1019A|nr:1-aminocyclopropane-1-carboxylate oxidase homolog [Solanum stenotomum]
MSKRLAESPQEKGNNHDQENVHKAELAKYADVLKGSRSKEQGRAHPYVPGFEGPYWDWVLIRKSDRSSDVRSQELVVLTLYYPACPRPELTIGTNKHSDNDFLTVLLQDHIGGLQVLHQNQWEWFDVPHMCGALVVNIEDLLQYISVEHRVLANKVGPRVSVPCFFGTDSVSYSKLYGPISELLSEDNPPKYRATAVKDYHEYFHKKVLDGTSASSRYKI